MCKIVIFILFLGLSLCCKGHLASGIASFGYLMDTDSKHLLQTLTLVLKLHTCSRIKIVV